MSDDLCWWQNVSKASACHIIDLIQTNEHYTFARLLCSEAILEGCLPPPGRTPRVWYCEISVPAVHFDIGFHLNARFTCHGVEFRCCDVQDGRRASIFAETKRSVCPAPFSLAPPEIVRANNLLCWLRGATEAPFPDAMEDQHASPDDSFENGYPGLDAETSQGFAQRPLNVRRRWAILTCGCVLNVTAPASDGATTDSVDAPGSTMPIATYHVLTGQVCQHMMALVRPVFRKEMLSPRWFDQETGEMQNLHLLTKD